MNAAGNYDVFNGDADGICALLQLRLATPRDAVLVTGVKRDIALLERVPASASEITVLDISFDNNHGALRKTLDAGARVFYVDHHSAREVFTHARLQFIHDESPAMCTSALVDRCLSGRQREWAVVAAFGDNLATTARSLAAQTALSAADIDALQTLGQLINYNAYGESVEDLHCAPDVLYRKLLAYAKPSAFIQEAPEYRALLAGHQNDMANVQGLRPVCDDACCAAYVLPDADWARRVSGEFANQLVARRDGRSCAVLTAKRDGNYIVSVRAANPQQASASDLCRQFESGGGRHAAAGINTLPATDVERFLAHFADHFHAGSLA